MTELVCLHLSDLHIGDPRFDETWANVGPAFKKDVTEVCNRLKRRIDLVIFTGDLVCNGREIQFRQLEERIISPLLSQLPVSNARYLLPVPGNHDLSRFDQAEGGVDHIVGTFCDRWNEGRTPFFGGRDPCGEAYIRDRFEHFDRWVADSAITVRPVKRGLLPGEASYTVTKDRVDFGFMVLNSAFLQLKKGNFEGLLDIAPQQYVAASPDGTTTWNEKHQFSVLLTHHPLDWLNARSRHVFEEEFRGHFTCHLYGHMHKPQTQFYAINGGMPRHSFQAASLSGLERQSETGALQREHGYSILAFEADASGPKSITYWGRRYQTVGGQAIFEKDGSQRYEADNDCVRYVLATKEPAPIAVIKVEPHVEARRQRKVPIHGRDSEIETTLALLEENSIVCLKGFGGVGKTAIAKAVAEQWEGTVAWVEVHAIDPHSPSQFVRKVMEQFARTGVQGEPEEPMRRADAAELTGSIPTNYLIVLDGFSLISYEVSRLLHELTERRTDLRILTTNWGNIDLIDVRVIDVEPLPFHEHVSDIAVFGESPAVRMFVDEVRRHDTRFAISPANLREVALIIGYSGGVPLAIKLIAATMRKRRSLGDICRTLMEGNIPTVYAADLQKHHQSMDGCFEQCRQQLSEAATKLLYAISLLPESFPRSHAEALGSPGSVDELFDASFLDFSNDRYSVHRLLRDFSSKRASADNFQVPEDSLMHLAQTWIAMDEAPDQEPDEFDVSPSDDDLEPAINAAGVRTVDDWNNGLKVFDLLIERSGRTTETSKLLANLNQWLRSTNQWEVRLRINRSMLAALRDAEENIPPQTLAMGLAWTRISIVECQTHKPGVSGEALVSECLDIIERIEEAQAYGQWTTKRLENLAAAKVSVLKRLVGISHTFKRIGVRELIQLTATVLEQRNTDRIQSRVLAIRGELFQMTEDWAAATKAYSEALAGASSSHAAFCHDCLGKIYLRNQKYLDAAREFEFNTTSERPDIRAKALSKQAEAISRNLQDPRKAEELFKLSIRLRETLGDPKGVGITRSLLASHYRRTNNKEMAECEIAEAVRVLSRYVSPELARAHVIRGEMAVSRGDMKLGQTDYERSYSILDSLKHPDRLISADRIAQTYERMNDDAAAGKWYAISLSICAEAGARIRDRRIACINADRFALNHPSNPKVIEYKPVLSAQASQLPSGAALDSAGIDVTQSNFASAALRIRKSGKGFRTQRDWSGLVSHYLRLEEKCDVRMVVRKAMIRTELGSAYRNQESFDNAIACLQAALGTFEEANLEEGIALAQHKLGDTFLEKSLASRVVEGTVEQSITHYQSSIAIKRKQDPIENTGLRISLAGLADAYATVGDNDAAARTFLEAAQLGDIRGGDTAEFWQKLDKFLGEHPAFLPQFEGVKPQAR